MPPTDPSPTPRPLDLLGTPPARLVELAAELGFSARRARLLFQAVHGQIDVPLEELRGTSRDLRRALAPRVRLASLLPSGERVEVEDGETRKLLFHTSDGHPVETVLMPRRAGGWTVCVSSQVGCRVGCTFCKTATMGLTRNLAAGEIVDQVRRARALAPGPVRNVVFMGMGEPLENLDAVLDAVEVLRAPELYAIPARRITVSTSGHVPGLRELGRRNPRLNVAISWNASDDATRDALMPINRRYPLASLIQVLRDYPLRGSETFMIEYVLLAGENDRPEDAARLRELLAGLPVKLNLIPWNPVEGLPHARPDEARIAAFREALGAGTKGVTERYSWGQGIEAACGQLGSTAPRPEGARDEPEVAVARPLPWSPLEV